MITTIDVLFGGSRDLALAVLITSGIGILFVGFAMLAGYRERRKSRKEEQK